MKRTVAQIGKRRIELSNLDKVLFPENKIVKAELIQYYLEAAPTILFHIKGRPLSLVRYPDGIGAGMFFQKNRPGWAPDWIEHAVLGDGEPTDYIIAIEAATLAWLANLACIELHQIQSRAPHFDKPDYIVYDLDPPEHYDFRRLAGLALDFREHVESYGYHGFVKTTGGKGVHIVTPLEPRWNFEQISAAASEVATRFVEKHGDSTTLQIKKEARKGRVLIDIYRNRPAQTIVSPYSVRGRAGAPVSMPLSWDELAALEDPAVFNLRNAAERLKSEGDPWEMIGAYAAGLHTDTAKPGQRRKAGVRKTGPPAALSEYSRKRSFTKSPEPVPRLAAGEGNAFVIHRHHASHLHYDLRLEKNGTLKSWAVPKGLPPRPGIKRLAIAVEDHPVEYLTFEGTIPKGEYGAGRMWVFSHGKYEITKEKKDGFYFRLSSREVNSEYRFINTRGKDWLLERVDVPQTDWLREQVDPMLAHARNRPPDSPDYLYEVKWDGIRALISVDEGTLTIHSRSRREITRHFPELSVPGEGFRASGALFDGEIVCLEPDGKPSFEKTIARLQQSGEKAIEKARMKHPAVCYVFDCLYLDGRPILNEPLVRRREWMADSIRSGTPFRVSESVDEGSELFKAAAEMGLEGIMAKRRDSPYLPGRRSEDWLKIKVHQTMDCVIVGFTRGKGGRAGSFGALQLASAGEDGGLRYVGKVGTGFGEHQMKRLSAELEKVPEVPRPVAEKPLDDGATTWIEPRFVCEVRFSSLTSEGLLREPVFVRLKEPTIND